MQDLQLHCSMTHLIFDPGRKSHPMAEKVHGYDDWTLRHQPLFSEYAGTVWGMINNADLIVAHNIAFDWEFICRSLKECGKEIPEKPIYCTMNEFRGRRLGVGASLTSAAGYFGIERQGRLHGALEDAWMAMGLYWRLNTPLTPIPFNVVEEPGFRNLRPVPVRPDGPLPRRKRRK